MGTYDGKFDVEVEYPTAFAKAILQGKKGGSERFRYVHLGGAFTVEDQEKTLWFLPTARRGRVSYSSSLFHLVLFAYFRPLKNEYLFKSRV